MASLLISFLGRAQYREDGKRGEYRETRYAFGRPGEVERWVSPPSKHFAHAVFRFQRDGSRARPFDRVVILGTSGSMWDSLADSFGSEGDAGLTETALRLSDLVDSQTVDQATLDRYAEELNAARQTDIRLRLIPSATEPNDQAEILSQIESVVEDQDRVWIDVTHGFRHLPMIGLAAASLITSHKNATIDEIAYGALDLTRDGETPVVSLTWILSLLRAIGGMSEMARNQNLKPLIACFPPGRLRDTLNDIAYKLDVMRIDEAATAARAAIRQLDESLADLPVELGLLAGVMRKRLEQYTEHSRDIKGLTQMARLALEQDDFLRTSIYLSEAVTIAVNNNLPGNNEEDAKLKSVRNWLAHAGELENVWADRQVKKYVANRAQLRQFLRSQLDRLWQEVRAAETR